MRLGLITILMLLLQAQNLHSQVIRLTITGVNAGKGGHLYAALFNGDEGYPDNDYAYKVKSVDVSSSTTVIVFEDVPLGTYAINVFHDENSNGRIDTNLLGIPTEGYGFSNNPRLFGPPSFRKTKFELDRQLMLITVRINY